MAKNAKRPFTVPRVLLFVLREWLGLLGAKDACLQGECGSCTVLLDGDPVCSCLVMAADAAGSEVVTVEGLGTEDELSPVQEAFVEHGAVQCGFCTPGFLISTTHLLKHNPAPTSDEIREALIGQHLPVHGVRGGAAGRGGNGGGGSLMTSTTNTRIRGGVGESVTRPDGIPKVQGGFAYASDLQAEGMLWGATRRSPHPHARITEIDIAPALAIAGVYAVLTHDDVPGRPTVGQINPDRPVLAGDEVRYWGQPIAITAAEDLETARRAAEAIIIEYERARTPHGSRGSPGTRRGIPPCSVRYAATADAQGEVVIEGYYEMGTQDQAALGTEAGIAFPDGEGGVDLYAPSQWIHEDHGQIVASLALRDEQVRVHPAGVGGAFGSREDLSLQVHLCLLALYTGRPVRMVYDRQESFAGHVHRHAARMWYRHECRRRRKPGPGRGEAAPGRRRLHGDLSGGHRQCRLLRDRALPVSQRGHRRLRRADQQPAVRSHARVRGRADLLRPRSPDGQTGRRTGDGSAGIAAPQRPGTGRSTADQRADHHRTLADRGGHRSRCRPCPLPDDEIVDDPLHLPGGTGLTTPPGGVVRGIGYAVGLKNLAFAEAFDDYAEARVVLTPQGVEVQPRLSKSGRAW